MRGNKPNRSVIVLLFVFVSGIATGDASFAQRPILPPAGNCKSMAASGQRNIWYGEFSGRYESMVNDLVYPVAARGCFTSEYECRRWTNQLLSITSSSGLTRCRPYGKRR